MTIVWRDKMSVGNDKIDTDHRYLISLINLVEITLRHNDDYFCTALEQLVEYTNKHFKREELIQLQIDYIGYNEHKIEHQNLLRALTSIVKDLKTQRDKHLTIKVGGDENSKSWAKEVDKLTELLRDWIVGHVLGSDMKMKPILKQFPVLSG